MMAQPDPRTTAWTPCPYAGKFWFDAASLRPAWGRLHKGDAEPLPTEPALLDGWVQFHNGDFESAARTGLQLDRGADVGQQGGLHPRQLRRTQ
jgi:hypothetical protein